MIEKLFYQLLHPRRFWRYATLDEVSELYVSMIMRSIALGLIGVFVPFYLYDLGFGMEGIAFFYVCFFVARLIFDIASAYIVGRIGPKHTILVSYITQLIASFSLFGLEDYGFPLILPAAVWGVSNSMFYVALHVDFSKVKHSKKGGQEFSYLEIAQKLGMALGPFVGGVIAYFFGASYIFLGATAIILLAVFPLLATPEPTKTHQKINFNLLPLNKIKWDAFSYICATTENNLRSVAWPLFLSLFALGSTGIYLKLGSISTIGLISSVISAYVAGRLVDSRKGRLLLNITSYGSALVHIVRPFINSIPGAIGVMIAGDVMTVGHQIPYHKGLYDKVEDLPGSRITYMSFLEAVCSFSKLIVWVLIAMLTTVISIKTILIGVFLLSALLSMGITTQRFRI